MATLVTGASAGLGEAFARRCAARGDALILTARRIDRLDRLARDLRAAHGVAVETIAADLASPAGPRDLLAAVAARGARIDTLVNNAGFGANGTFAELPLDEQLAQIAVNCSALVALSHAVLRGMIDRGDGAILNVASTAAFQAGPYMAVYYATKAFVLSFSEALHEEAKPHGIRVSALCPGPVATEFAAVAGMADNPLFARMAADADTVARDGLEALAANRAIKVAGTANAVMAIGERLVPRSLTRKLAGRISRSR